MARYSISDYAKRVGLSREYFYKLAKQGKIDFFLNGKKKEIESDLVDPIIKFRPAGRDTHDTYQKNGAKREDKPLGPEATTSKKVEFEKNTGSEFPTLQKIEIAIKAEKLKKLRAENAKSDNDLVRIDEVVSKVFGALRPLRDDILAISKRVSSTAFTAGSKHEAEQIIRDETDRILLSRVGDEHMFDDALKKKILSMLTL